MSQQEKAKYVVLDQDHRHILKCFSGKRLKYHCWCDDHHDWKEMDYFNATRIGRVRIDLRQEPNWWRVAEKKLNVKNKVFGSSYKVLGYAELPDGDWLYLANPMYETSVLSVKARDYRIDFEKAGLEIHEEIMEDLG